MQEERNPFQPASESAALDFFQVIGAKNDIDMDTSETSSYQSSSSGDTEVVAPAEVEAINTEIIVETNVASLEAALGAEARPLENLHEETKESAVSKNKKKKKKAKLPVNMDSDDGGENTCTYKSTRTKNEIDPDLAWQVGPEALDLDHLDEILPFGTVVQYIS